MQLSPQQAQAKDAVIEWYNDPGRPTFYLGGYAGTGKTTIAKDLTESLEAKHTYMAYTGKAASVLSKKGCLASTIHSSIYKLLPVDKAEVEKIKEQMREGVTPELKEKMDEVSKPRFVLDIESEFMAGLDLIVVDEVSMVNEALALDLLSFEKKILVLGDPGQLPPVSGEGYFTKDKPDFMLTEIHRQAQDSPIIRMATMVRQGNRLRPGMYGPGCGVVAQNSVKFEDYDQIIVGANKTRHLINAHMRKGYPAIPALQEKLICLRNNREQGLLNGTQWETCEIEDKGTHLTMRLVSLDTDRKITVDVHPFNADVRAMSPWERRRFNEFDYGYAITCHKSQGSQWNKIYIRDESWMFKQDSSKWMYTALTRAETSVTVGV